MSVVETLRKISPKGHQPSPEEIETNSAFQNMRMDCVKALDEYGTRVKHKGVRLLPFIYPATILYKLTPWQVGDGIELTARLEAPEEEGEEKSFTISLMSPYVSDPKKAPSLILHVEEADVHMVLTKDYGLIRDNHNTINSTLRHVDDEDVEVYHELVKLLRQSVETNLELASDPKG